MGAVAATAIVPNPSSTNAAVRSAPTINVRDFGAFGNGKVSDLQQVRAAVAKAGDYPGGVTVLFPPGDYFLGPADNLYQLVAAHKLQKVRFVGERATISCRSVSGQSNMLVLDGCHTQQGCDAAEPDDQPLLLRAGFPAQRR